MANERSDLVGTWKLVGATSVMRDGERNETPYGVDPVGLLSYTLDGRMTSIISYGGRKALSMHANAEEKAEAFNTFLAYAGRYSLTEGKVTHHVEISSVQNYVSKDLVRTINFGDNRITLTTPPTLLNGKIQSVELVWERMLPNWPLTD